MSVKRLQTTLWLVIIGSMLIGGVLGIYLIGKETGEYNYELLLPMGIGSVGGLVIFLANRKFKQKRNGNVPDYDERSALLIQKYFMIALYVILFGSGAALLVAYAMGIQYIETGLLIMCLFGIFMVLGVGALVAKRL
ncbi:hypothetical protein [Solibacillus sp. FSL H8-0538]|uniref:hypothetical protein n=1 Tax=Solibacillus sp. FSL H8-0538 TaxID=2921400 RepID=UPI0030F6119C